ncbi:hypothetical protein FACS1894140_5030 [Spirochaetia bacterium]|nr:hypothetical protein FACS1894140_5030 [Spirochaetia bacterium]
MEKNGQVFDLVPNSVSKSDTAEVLSTFTSFITELARNGTELARIKAMENVMITNITRKYDLYHEVLMATFYERSKIIKKYFDVIDKGIRTNDNSLILGGLNSLTEVVKTSPFANILANGKEFDRIMDSRDKSLPPL